MTDAVLTLRDFRVTFPTMNGDVQAVRGVNLDVRPGEMLGIVGESGSGKSVTFLGLMGLLPKRTRITGSAKVNGVEMVDASAKVVRPMRGRQIAMIFQDPLSALNPVQRIGNQIVEMIRSHNDVSKKAAMSRAIANDPSVLIADEPTTALDVTVQAQILEVIQRIQNELQTAVVLITHDLGVVARVADRVQVMYAGRAVERGDVGPLFDHPSHPYTRGLMQSLPGLGRERLTPIAGAPPNMLNPPKGCPFAPRCMHTRPECTAALPELVEFGDLETACVRASELATEVVA